MINTQSPQPDERTGRRTLVMVGLGLAAVVALIVAVVAGWSSSSEDGADSAVTGNETAQPSDSAADESLSDMADSDDDYPRLTEASEADPESGTVAFDGEGDALIQLPQAVVEPSLVEMQYEGPLGDVVVVSESPDGMPVDPLITHRGGTFTSTTLTATSDFSELSAIRVTAPGAWTISVAPLSEAPRWDGRKPVDGSDGIVLLVEGIFEKNNVLAYSGSGPRFDVWAYSPDTPRASLVEGAEPWTGEVLILDNPIALVVDSESAWSLERLGRGAR